MFGIFSKLQDIAERLGTIEEAAQVHGLDADQLVNALNEALGA